MNHKNERIKKLWNRGLQDPAVIAKKTGLSLRRVLEGLRWLQDDDLLTPVKESHD